MQYAFRCKECGHLHDGAHAGQNTLPVACRVCGKGSRTDKSNWEVLSEMPPSRLVELGLTPEQVTRHEPTSNDAENLERCKESVALLTAKRDGWEARKSAAIEEYKVVRDEFDKHEKVDFTTLDPADIGKVQDAKVAAKNRLHDIVAEEFTPRDAKALAELEAAVAAGGGAMRAGGKEVFGSAFDGVGASDKA